MLWGTRKVRRIARSSLTAEVVALRTTIDTCYWFQALLHEAIYGNFLLDPFDPAKPSPLFAPFSTPTEMDSAAEKSVYLSPQVAVRFQQSQILSLILISTLDSESDHVSVPFSWIRQQYAAFIANHDVKEVIPILILTDSANAFSSSHGGNPRSIDRHTRIHMCYIRDGMGRYNLSFCAAGFNLADCGTKLRGQTPLVDIAFASSRCRIGFLSRVEMHRLKETLGKFPKDDAQFSGR